MRRDRREEIMAQMEADKRAEKRKRGNGFCRFLSILYTILAAAFVVLLIKLNALPAKYLYTGIAALVIASIFIVPVMFIKRLISSAASDVYKRQGNRGLLCGRTAGGALGERQRHQRTDGRHLCDERFALFGGEGQAAGAGRSVVCL